MANAYDFRFSVDGIGSPTRFSTNSLVYHRVLEQAGLLGQKTVTRRGRVVSGRAYVEPIRDLRVVVPQTPDRTWPGRVISAVDMTFGTGEPYLFFRPKDEAEWYDHKLLCRDVNREIAELDDYLDELEMERPRFETFLFNVARLLGGERSEQETRDGLILATQFRESLNGDFQAIEKVPKRF